MIGYLLRAVLVATALAAPRGRIEPITLRPAEDLLFFGDSISCPWAGNYTTLVECYLRTRLPGMALSVANVSWPGETARGALARFSRDATPVHPTLVVLGFGMNDGIRDESRAAADETMLAVFRNAQEALAGRVKALGARPILLTTSCVDYREPDRASVAQGAGRIGSPPPEGYQSNHELDVFPQYNATLALFSDQTVRLADRLGLACIDIFNAMIAIQRAMKRGADRTSLSSDSIHPNAAGYLVMTYLVLRNLAAPRTVADIVVGAGGGVTATPGTVDRVTPSALGPSFRLRPATLPFYVSPESREALSLVPFEAELNPFTLRAAGRNPGAPGWLYCDDRLIARCSGRELAAGVDLALLDGAPWAAKFLKLQAEVVSIGDKFRDLWRDALPIEGAADQMAPPVEELSPAPDGFSSLLRPPRSLTTAQVRAWAAASRALSRIAAPGAYQIALKDHDPLLRPAERPVMLEGWEGDNPLLWGIAETHGALRAGADAPSQGAQHLRLVPDRVKPRRIAAVSLCQPELNLSRASAFALDVRVPSARGPITVTLTLSSSSSSRRMIAAPVTPVAGTWTTVAFESRDATWGRSGSGGPTHANRISSIGLAFESSGTGSLPDVIDVDNLRVTR